MLTVSKPSIMQASKQSCENIPEKSLSIHNTLKDDGVPAFMVEIVTVIFLRCYDGDVRSINSTNTVWDPPPVLKLGSHFFKLFLIWITNLLWYQHGFCCCTELLNTPTHTCYAYTKKMANTSVMQFYMKLLFQLRELFVKDSILLD